jgi:hypothetical protein
MNLFENVDSIKELVDMLALFILQVVKHDWFLYFLVR